MKQTFPPFAEYVFVDVTSGHKVLVSFPWAEIHGCLLLTTQATAGARFSTAVSVCCGMPPSPGFYDTPRLTLHFDNTFVCHFYREWANKVYHETNTTGFRMLFSVHNKSSQPEQLPDSTWNCSVPYWSSFMNHFLCNFHSECSGKEDEADCPYTTEHCGPGYFAAGDACFFLERGQNGKTSWMEASDMCLARGGKLASLKTKQRYEGVRRFLQLQKWTQTVFFVGLGISSPIFPLWYNSIHQWLDDTVALHDFVRGQSFVELRLLVCGHLEHELDITAGIVMENCHRTFEHGIAVCERSATHKSDLRVVLSMPNQWSSSTMFMTCPSKHLTHTFLACDVQSFCFLQNYDTCSVLMTPHPPSFQCRNLVQNVPYTLVCDHRSDCTDSSDEDFCVFQGCDRGQFSCGNQQYVSDKKRCNQWRDCFNGNDEMECLVPFLKRSSLPPPALVDIGNNGLLIYKHLNSPSTAQNTPDICPQTHFQCPNNSFCLPVFLRCNGVFDCTYHEDEVDCDIYTCPGFYRCRSSTVCVHQSHVCDGRPHCPQHDDELLCDLKCPVSCVCRGLAFFCSHIVHIAEYPALRFLDAEGTNMTLTDVRNNHLLIFLSLARCGLTDSDFDEGNHFPNLITLDVSDNSLATVDSIILKHLPNVKELVLSGNPLVHIFDETQGVFRHLQILDVSRVRFELLNVTKFSVFTNLQIFNLSGSGIDDVLGKGFRHLKQLRVLDLRGCPLTKFPGEMFHGLANLQAVYAQSFHICCPILLPANFNLRKCEAPAGDISSCEDLLGSLAYKVSAFIVALAALVGNSITFFYRTVVNRSRAKSGFSVFVTHLSVSDFFMGVYLSIIWNVDQVYEGIYLWNDFTWRHSALCSMAGFLSLLSSEASALIVCLITADRFMVMCFPFSRLHFGVKSAHAASVMVWILSLIIVSVPLLPITSHWQFYSQTGICIPLPVSRTNFPGRMYSFGIIIILNFALFLFICLGQLLIYCSVRANTMSVKNTSQKKKDITIARRLITVAMSDFLCWFPIGILGLLASSGVPIPAQISVSMAVFVLPLNSALNPFLYTVNVILDRRRRTREEKMRVFLAAQISKNNSCVYEYE